MIEKAIHLKDMIPPNIEEDNKNMTRTQQHEKNAFVVGCSEEEKDITSLPIQQQQKKSTELKT